MIDIASALRAYSQAPKPQASAEAGDTSGFSEMLNQTLEQTVDATRTGEKAMLGSATGKAELVDVVTAVANAETSLETVIALRDRVITAYQEILRMPI